MDVAGVVDTGRTRGNVVVRIAAVEPGRAAPSTGTSRRASS